MIKKLYKWFRQHYRNIINSIAFYPIIIASSFLALAFLLLQLDISALGQNIVKHIEWLQLNDSDTARTMVATIAGGILSLAVFSFSMVMILLNQSAVNMSNRILDSMIGNRYHQVILGTYIGTIVYALFLLSTIRDIDSYRQIPSLSIFFLIALTIVDIFLFIYFLHYITQSVKFETIINRLHKDTYKSLLDNYTYEHPDRDGDKHFSDDKLYTKKSGYLYSIGTTALLAYCKQEDIKIAFAAPFGTYFLEGSPYATVANKAGKLTEEQVKQLHNLIDISNNQIKVAQDPYLGCKHLAEVAIKALSPGINDPGTAIQSLNAIGDILAYRINHHPKERLRDDEDTERIYLIDYCFDDYINISLWPIWDYGKDDRMTRKHMKHIVSQLHALCQRESDIQAIEKLQKAVEGA